MYTIRRGITIATCVPLENEADLVQRCRSRRPVSKSEIIGTITLLFEERFGDV